jgi:porphobilinogen synthase
LINRPRRLRSTAAIRDLIAETNVLPRQLMLPVFVREGLAEPRKIKGMPGVNQHTEQSFLAVLDQAVQAGLKSVMLFAIPELRDEIGSEATNPEGILNRSVRSAKDVVGDELVVVADLCLDEFTSHGHCGVLDENNFVDNDRTLVRYQEMALQLARSGADMLGLSGMMDGQVQAVREALDEQGFSQVAILAYGAKYASSFYGPFRNAVESQLVGDRKSYQQDSRNSVEALRELRLDIEQGADVVMVKPALGYLDVVRAARELSEVPVAAYLVSGELAMIELAASNGLIDRRSAILEAVTSCARAGANIICTYWALEVAQWLREEI